MIVLAFWIWKIYMQRRNNSAAFFAIFGNWFSYFLGTVNWSVNYQLKNVETLYLDLVALTGTSNLGGPREATNSRGVLVGILGS